MMKRLIALLLGLALLLSATACKKEKYPIEAQVHNYDYTVQFNGRTYATKGTPCQYKILKDTETLADYRTRNVGSIEELGGNFPAGTEFYGLDGVSIKTVLLAILPKDGGYYLAVSYDSVDVRSGKSILSAMKIDEGNCAALYLYNEDQSRMRMLELDSEQLEAFNAAFSAGKLTEATGRSAALLMRAHTGELCRITLYENNAVVFEACPAYAVDLGEEIGALLWDAIG